MFDILNFLSTKPIKLTRGKGHPDTGGCWMSALSCYAGEDWSDHPDCVCDAVAPLCVVINDSLGNDDARGRIIGPRLLDPVGTNNGPELGTARSWVVFDAAIRRWLPDFLARIGKEKLSHALRNLPEITATTFPDVAPALLGVCHIIGGPVISISPGVVIGDISTFIREAMRTAGSLSVDYGRFATYASHIAGLSASTVPDKEAFVIDHMFPVLDKLLAMGNRTPIEMKCQPSRMAIAVGVHQ